MKITDGKIKKAQKVLAELKKISIRKDIEEHTWLETYTNCREQGFAIAYWPIDGRETLRVLFSENRNSDDIVVYVGTGIHSAGGNIPTDEAHENRRFFAYNAYKEAAEYIALSLLKYHAGDPIYINSESEAAV